MQPNLYWVIFEICVHDEKILRKGRSLYDTEMYVKLMNETIYDKTKTSLFYEIIVIYSSSTSAYLTLKFRKTI